MSSFRWARKMQGGKPRRDSKLVNSPRIDQHAKRPKITAGSEAAPEPMNSGLLRRPNSTHPPPAPLLQSSPSSKLNPAAREFVPSFMVDPKLNARLAAAAEEVRIESAKKTLGESQLSALDHVFARRFYGYISPIIGGSRAGSRANSGPSSPICPSNHSKMLDEDRCCVAQHTRFRYPDNGRARTSRADAQSE